MNLFYCCLSLNYLFLNKLHKKILNIVIKKGGRDKGEKTKAIFSQILIHLFVCVCVCVCVSG